MRILLLPVEKNMSSCEIFLGKFATTTSGSELLWRKIIGILWLFAPLAIFAFSPLMSKEAGECVTWRPPKETYSVVWTVIILCLMASWVFISRNAALGPWIGQVVLYFIVIFLSILWILMYRQNKRNGIAVFVALLMVLSVTVPLSFKVNIYAGVLLLPLVVWAIFNLGINCAEIQCSK